MATYTVRPWSDVEADARQRGADDKAVQGLRERYDRSIADMRQRDVTIREEGGGPPASRSHVEAGAVSADPGFLSGVARGGARVLRAIEQPFEVAGEAVRLPTRHVAAEALARAGVPKRAAKAVGRAAGGTVADVVSALPTAPAFALLPEATVPAILGAGGIGAAYGGTRAAARKLTGETPGATPANVGEETAETAAGFMGGEAGGRALQALARPVLRRVGRALSPLARLAAEDAGMRSGPTTAPFHKPGDIGTGAGSTPPEATPPTHHAQPPRTHTTAPTNEPGPIGQGAGSTPPEEPPSTEGGLGGEGAVPPKAPVALTAADMTSAQPTAQASGRSAGRLQQLAGPIERPAQLPSPVQPAPTGPSGMARPPLPDAEARFRQPGAGPTSIAEATVRTAPRLEPVRSFREALGAERQIAAEGRRQSVARKAFEAARAAPEPPPSASQAAVEALTAPGRAESTALRRARGYAGLQARAAGLGAAEGGTLPAEVPVIRPPGQLALPPPAPAVPRPPNPVAAAARAARGRDFTLVPPSEVRGAAEEAAAPGTQESPLAQAQAGLKAAREALQAAISGGEPGSAQPSPPRAAAPRPSAAPTGPPVEPLPDAIVAGKSHAELQSDLEAAVEGVRSAKSPTEQLFYRRLQQTIQNALARPEEPAVAPEAPPGPKPAAPAAGAERGAPPPAAPEGGGALGQEPVGRPVTTEAPPPVPEGGGPAEPERRAEPRVTTPAPPPAVTEEPEPPPVVAEEAPEPPAAPGGREPEAAGAARPVGAARETPADTTEPEEPTTEEAAPEEPAATAEPTTVPPRAKGRRTVKELEKPAAEEEEAPPTRITHEHPARQMAPGVRKLIDRIIERLNPDFSKPEDMPISWAPLLDPKELETLRKAGLYDPATQTVSPKFVDQAAAYQKVREAPVEFVPGPVEEPKKAKPRVGPDDLKAGGRALKAMQRFTSADETRMNLSGVYHDPEGMLVATDGHRLIVVPGKAGFAPDTMVDEAGRKIDGEFPAWENAAPKLPGETAGDAKAGKGYKKMGELTPAQLRAHTDAAPWGRPHPTRGSGKLTVLTLKTPKGTASVALGYAADVAKAFDDLGVPRMEVWAKSDLDPVIFREVGDGDRIKVVQMPVRGGSDLPHVHLRYDLTDVPTPKPARTRAESVKNATDTLEAELRAAADAQDWPKVARLTDELKILRETGKPLPRGGIDPDLKTKAQEFAADLGLTRDQRITLRDMEPERPSALRALTSADFALRKHPIGRKIVLSKFDAFDRAQQLLRTFLGTWHSVVGSPRGAIGEKVLGSHYAKLTPKDEAAFVRAGHASESMGRLLDRAELQALGLSDRAVAAYRTHNRLMHSWLSKVINPWRVKQGLDPIPHQGGFYWPHEFFGNWRITVDGAAHVTPSGASWPTEAEAYRVARTIQQEHPDAKVELVPEYQKYLTTLGGETYGDIGTLYKAAEIFERSDRVTADMIRQAVNEKIVPSGFRRRFAERKGKLGYDTAHIFDTLESYHRQAAFWVTDQQAHKGFTDARGRHHAGIDELVQRIDRFKEPRTWEAIDDFLHQAYGHETRFEHRLNDVLSRTPLARYLDPLRPATQALGAGRALTARLKLGFANYGVAMAHLMHAGTNILPTLGPKYFGVGVRETLMPSARSLERLAWGERHGVFRPRLLEEAAGRAMAPYATRTQAVLRGLWQPISVTERWLREIGYLGSIARLEEKGLTGDRLVRLATDDFLKQLPDLERGSEQVLRNMAKRVNELVNFRYDRASRPQAFTGPIGSMLGQFKTYITGTVQLQKRMFDLGLKDGARPLLLHLGALGALGGVTGGFPFAHLLDDTLKKWFHISPLDYLLHWADDYDREHGGKTGQVVMRGLPALADADVTRRVGYSHLHLDRLQDVLGPLINTVTDFATFLMLHDVEHLAPLAPGANNFYQAWKWSTEQVARDPYHRDRVRFTPSDWDIFLKSMGIQPLAASRQTEELGFEATEVREFQAKKNDLVDRLVSAFEREDDAAVDAAMAEAAEAGIPIDAKTVRQAMQAKQTPALERRLKTVPKALRPQFYERVQPLLEQEQAREALRAAQGGRR
jgi:hypothetical protein